MRNWFKILEEQPSSNLEKRILANAEKEMGLIRQESRRSFWRQLSYVLVPAVTTAAGILWFKSRPQSESEVDPEFVELAFGGDDLSEEEIESLEDIFLLEHLEELEEWNS